MEDLRDTTLWLTLWSYSLAWQNKFLGEICIPFDEETFTFSDDPDYESPPIICILQDYSNQRTDVESSLTRKKKAFYLTDKNYRKRGSEGRSSAPDILQSDELNAYESNGAMSLSEAKEDSDSYFDDNISTSISVEKNASPSETITQSLPVSTNLISTEEIENQESKAKPSGCEQEEERETDDHLQQPAEDKVSFFFLMEPCMYT